MPSRGEAKEDKPAKTEPFKAMPLEVAPKGLKWVPIPGGTFRMGCSPTDELSTTEEEKPAHSVTVSTFQMLETEVTEAQYQAVMGGNPSCNRGGGGGADKPVECVNWDNSRAFCERIDGRLPTEAEWEYAARGGTTTKYYCGDNPECINEVAWYDKNSEGVKHSVKQKLPNAFGLYDMLGNVWEWTADWYSDTYYADSPTTNPQGPSSGSFRANRGGYFGTNVYDVRVSSRLGSYPSYEGDFLGLRCARSVEPSTKSLAMQGAGDGDVCIGSQCPRVPDPCRPLR